MRAHTPTAEELECGRSGTGCGVIHVVASYQHRGMVGGKLGVKVVGRGLLSLQKSVQNIDRWKKKAGPSFFSQNQFKRSEMVGGQARVRSDSRICMCVEEEEGGGLGIVFLGGKSGWGRLQGHTRNQVGGGGGDWRI